MRSILRDRSGATSLEFGVAATVLLLLMFGIIDFGRLLWTQGALQYAVEQAARCAAIGASACSTTGDTQNYAAGKMYAQNVSSSVFSVSTPSCGTQVTASMSFNFVSAFFPGSLTLTAKSCRPS